MKLFKLEFRNYCLRVAPMFRLLLLFDYGVFLGLCIADINQNRILFLQAAALANSDSTAHSSYRFVNIAKEVVCTDGWLQSSLIGVD